MRRLANRFHGWVGENPVTAILVALGLGGVAVFASGGTFFRGENTRDIVTRSPCVSQPAGVDCQRSKRESDEARSVRDICIQFWKVGYPCPKPDSGVTIRSMRGGDVSQPAPTAGQLSEPPASGGNGEAPPEGGSDETPTPDKTADAGQPPPPSTAGAGAPPVAASPGSASPPPTPEKTAEQDNGLVEDVGETVKETACSLTEPLVNLC